MITHAYVYVRTCAHSRRVLISLARESRVRRSSKQQPQEGEGEERVTAEEVYARMRARGLAPNELTYGTLIDMCVFSWVWMWAWDRMYACHACVSVGGWNHHRPYQCPTPHTHNNSYAERRDAAGALRVFEEMVCEGRCRPNDVILGTLMKVSEWWDGWSYGGPGAGFAVCDPLWPASPINQPTSQQT